MKLLLIEDEVSLSDALAYMLRKNGYLVDTTYDGISGEEMAETDAYDLLIVDRMLPKKEGVEIIRALRNKGIKTPTLILTARDSINDRVEGLDAGADDYLIKPFSTQELLARIRALSRRYLDNSDGESLTAGCAVFKPLHKEIIIGEEVIKLTLKETQLLEIFFRNKMNVLTRDQIINKVWGLDSDVEMNIVEIYIHNLRKKLAPRKCHFIIETVRGIGYTLKEVNNV